MQRFVNNWQASLLTPASPGQTTLSINHLLAEKLIGLGEGDYYRVTAAKGDQIEILSIVSQTAGVLTVERAREGTVALSLEAGAVLDMRVTAETLGTLAAKQAEQASSLTSLAEQIADIGAPSSSGAVVGNVLTATNDHNGSYITTSAATLTLANQSNGAWTAGAALQVEQAGDVELSITGQAGVEIRHRDAYSPTLAGQYAVVQLKRVSENIWTLTGDLALAAPPSPPVELDYLLAVAIDVAPYIVLREKSDWTTAVGPSGLEEPYVLTASPDGAYLVSAADSLTIYRTSDWSTVTLSSPPSGWPNRTAFSPDSSLFAVQTSAYPYIYLYNTADWSLLPELVGMPDTPVSVSFSPDGGKFVTCGAYNNPLVVYDTSTWTPTSLSYENAYHNLASFSPDGAVLAVALQAAPFLALYNTTDWSRLPGPSALPLDNAFTLSFSPDSSRLYVGGAGGLIGYNTTDWSTAPGLPAASLVSYVSVSPDGAYLAVTREGVPVIEVYDTSTWTLVSAASGSIPSDATRSYGMDWIPKTHA